MMDLPLNKKSHVYKSTKWIQGFYVYLLEKSKV